MRILPVQRRLSIADDTIFRRLRGARSLQPVEYKACGHQRELRAALTWPSRFFILLQKKTRRPDLNAM
jgi:hypothetical protein